MHKCLQDWGCLFFFFLYSYNLLSGVYCSLLGKWFVDWIGLFRSHSSLNDTIPHIAPGPTQGFSILEATFIYTFPRLPPRPKLNSVIMTQDIQGVHAGRCWRRSIRVKWMRNQKGQVGFGEQCVCIRVVHVVSVELCIAEWGIRKPCRFWGGREYCVFPWWLYILSDPKLAVHHLFAQPVEKSFKEASSCRCVINPSHGSPFSFSEGK